MTDYPKKGSGDELGRIDLGPLGELVFKDDGHDDTDYHLVWEYETPDGAASQTNLGGGPASLRRERGDTDFMATLADLDATGRGRPRSARTSTTPPTRGPPAFKCDDCNETFPRGQNQNPGSGDDLCPGCAGDDD